MTKGIQSCKKITAKTIWQSIKKFSKFLEDHRLTHRVNQNLINCIEILCKLRPKVTVICLSALYLFDLFIILVAESEM